MSEVTEQEIQLSKELNDIGEDLEGVRNVQSIYGQMPSENYRLFVIADVDQLATLKEQISILETNLKPNGDGKNQVVLMVNNADKNPLVFMANEMKDVVIDGFKSTLPALDDQLEVAFNAKKAELEATQE